jgi:hypothetical protein
MRSSWAWFLAGCFAACYFTAIDLRPATGQAAQRNNAAKNDVAPNAASEIDEELARQKYLPAMHLLGRLRDFTNITGQFSNEFLEQRLGEDANGIRAGAGELGDESDRGDAAHR